MKAIIKEIHSPDISDLPNFVPEEHDNFCVYIQVIIGPENKQGGESFDFLVCSPTWIMNETKKDKIFFGKGYIVVDEYCFSKIYDFILDLCLKTSGDSWKTIANKLSRYGNWEFKDYLDCKNEPLK